MWVLVAVALAIVLIALIVANQWSSSPTVPTASRPNGAAPAGQEQEGTSTPPSAGAVNEILVESQGPASSVRVAFVSLLENGFVVVHEETDGIPGAILGVSGFVRAGANKDISVSLSRSSKSGEKLLAILHGDDGNERFDERKDEAIKVAGGGLVVFPFTIGK